MEIRNRLSKILEECLSRIRNGESIDVCLDDYPDVREQLEPMLRTALSVSKMPRIMASDKFRNTAKGRLMARLRRESNPANVVEFERAKADDDE